MKISPALPATLTGVVIYALSGPPWMLLVVVILVLLALFGFVRMYVGWSEDQHDVLLELIRTLQGR